KALYEVFQQRGGHEGRGIASEDLSGVIHRAMALIAHERGRVRAPHHARHLLRDVLPWNRTATVSTNAALHRAIVDLFEGRPYDATMAAHGIRYRADLTALRVLDHAFRFDRAREAIERGARHYRAARQHGVTNASHRAELRRLDYEQRYADAIEDMRRGATGEHVVAFHRVKQRRHVNELRLIDLHVRMHAVREALGRQQSYDDVMRAYRINHPMDCWALRELPRLEQAVDRYGAKFLQALSLMRFEHQSWRQTARALDLEQYADARQLLIEASQANAPFGSTKQRMLTKAWAQTFKESM
ncbi:MAG TPA: hypothetical protein VFS42_07975, partial [Burkholderiaceae bacterium]|nr:hypothetical protein [Burkholderiaceae bacterium]